MIPIPRISPLHHRCNHIPLPLLAPPPLQVGLSSSHLFSSSHHLPFSLSGLISSLSEKENQLKSLHISLLKSSLLLLIDMNLQSITCSSPATTTTTSQQDTKMEYSQFSQILLYHLRRENLNTYCLHSSTNVWKEKSLFPNLTTPQLQQQQLQQQPSLSHHPFLQFSRLYLNETRMIHLVNAFLPSLLPPLTSFRLSHVRSGIHWRS
jgi:hypothetical protein